jgi:hypothetical protein
MEESSLSARRPHCASVGHLLDPLYVPTTPFSDLTQADLIVDAIYQSGRGGHYGDDPFPILLGMSNQGGFRYRGDLDGPLEMVLLTSTLNEPDWPDSLDPETGIFTYYGDNRHPGRELHDTGRGGNILLKRIFEMAEGGAAERLQVPPVFIFARAGNYRDAVFLGLAVPGASDLSGGEDLVAIWRTAAGRRFQNYRARFTVLDASVVERRWINSLIEKKPRIEWAPEAWRKWVLSGKRKPLLATRTMEYRTQAEQEPADAEGRLMIAAVRAHFQQRPHDFEHFAAAVARLILPDIAALDVTRPSRDGGRDGIGQLRVGSGPGAILVDFALEAKCYTPPTSVGVKDVSRLISRLRHRQFGILVTTTWVNLQAYREIKEDQHPIIVLAAVDIVNALRRTGRIGPVAVSAWLAEEFPEP